MQTGFYHPHYGYWFTTGVIPPAIRAGYPEDTIEVPLRPSDDHYWIDGAWLLVERDTALDLAEWRASAVVTKIEFINRAADAGIITNADAMIAARGEWPGAMADFLLLLNEKQKREAVVEWGQSTVVERANAFIMAMGSWLSLTEEQIDALFMDPAP